MGKDGEQSNHMAQTRNGFHKQRLTCSTSHVSGAVDAAAYLSKTVVNNDIGQRRLVCHENRIWENFVRGEVEKRGFRVTIPADDPQGVVAPCAISY